MKMQEMRNEINYLWKDGLKYNKQKFFTLILDKLGKNVGDLLSGVKR